MDNNKKNPIIRFEEFKELYEKNGGDSNLENPYAWEQRKLGEVADVIGGGTPSTSISEYWNGDIDWYSPVEIGEKIYVNGSQKKITKLGLQKSSARMLPVGTILFTSRAGIGNTAILEKEGCTNQGFQSIIPHKDELDSYFIFSRTHELKRYGETNGAGSTFVEVSGKQMAMMPILLPTMEEQQKIGDFFKTLDDSITLQQRKVDKILNLKKAMLEKMFPKDGEKIPEVRFEKFKKLYEENGGDSNPENPYAWEQRKLGDFVIKAVDNRGKTPPTQEFGRYPLLEVASLGKASPDYTKVIKYVDEETYNGWFRAHIKKDDILFSTVGNTGLVTLMDGYAGATIAQNIVGFRAIEGNNPQFLVQMFQLPENLKRAKRIEMGAVQPSIKVSQLIHVSYLLPNSEQEQTKIGTFFKHLDNTIALQQHKLTKLKNIKKALLKKMFI